MIDDERHDVVTSIAISTAPRHGQQNCRCVLRLFEKDDTVNEKATTPTPHENTVPPDPTLITARGAYAWARRLRDEEWEIPLFSFADNDATTL